MTRGKTPPTIPDGTTLQYLPGVANHLAVKADDPNTWSCYCLSSIPVERGEEVVIFNRKTLISNKKFTVKFRGQQLHVKLLEHNSGLPK